LISVRSLLMQLHSESVDKLEASNLEAIERLKSATNRRLRKRTEKGTQSGMASETESEPEPQPQPDPDPEPEPDEVLGMDVESGSPSNQDDQVKDPLQQLLDGVTSFVSFIEVMYTPNVQDLLAAFLLGFALICRAGQAGVDIVIPVLLGSPISPEGPVWKHRGKHIPGVFRDNESLVFEGVDTEQRDDTFGSLAEMRAWKEKDSIASKLLEGFPPDFVAELLQKMSCICLQVKNSSQNRSADDEGIDPKRACFRDLDGTWKHRVWSKPFIAVKHVLQPTEASIQPMKRSRRSPHQYGIVLSGFDASRQPCLDGDIVAAIRQVVETVSDPCATAGDSANSRLVAASIVGGKYKLAPTSTST